MSVSWQCSLLFAAAIGTPLPAQAPSGFSPDEARAFELKSRGQYGEAARLLIRLADRGRGDRRDAALAEFHAVVGALLARRAGESSFRAELLRVADGGFARSHPALRDRLLHLALDFDRAAGDHAGALERTHLLGYVGRWWFVGPFDNERGAGFSRAFGPELALDLDATYDGEKRPVKWRLLPELDPPAGIVNLDAVVRPNDQVLCYAAVALVSETEQDVIVHLGSDEAFKLFLNGAEVASRDVRRRFSPDQDAYRLGLRAGPNLLLLKVCDQEGPFAFAARLRAADGRPTRGVVVSHTKEDLRAAAQATASEQEPAAARPFRGALTVFRESVDRTGDPADAFRLGLMLGLEQPDDENDRRDRELARIAAAGLPDFAPAQYLVAFTRVRSGRAAEKDENARRQDYEAILEQHPEHAESLRSLSAMDLDETGLATTAERRLRRALEINPDFQGARLLLASVLRKLRMRELSEAEIERAAQPDRAGRRAPDAVLALFRNCLQLGRYGRAEALIPAVLANTYGSGVAVEVANFLLRRGELDRARELLTAAKRLAPFARGPRLRLARTWEATAELDRAVNELQEWLEICPEDDQILVVLARLSGLEGQVDRQREFLRTAIELNPNRKTERRHLEFLEAAESPFYEDFVIDGDAVLAADTGPLADAAEANDPYHYLLRQEVVRAYRNGTTSRYRHEILRVLSEEGARRMTDWVVQHFWGEQRARLLAVRVHKRDGRVLRPRLSGSYTKLPPLVPGDRLEIRERVDDVGPTFFGDYFGLVHRFASRNGLPVARSELVLILDPGREYRFQSANGAAEPEARTTDDGLLVHTYSMRELARRVTEERSPDWQELEPIVRVTTYSSWNDFSSWWWNLVRKQSRVSPAIRAKVRELTDGVADERSKIDAIYRFVTHDIRYEAWEFGVHGYKPYDAPVIFDRRHGDCKDKSILLNAMLGEIGVEAYPVLIHADRPRSADDLSLPMVEHFNHCISYLPPSAGRPPLFLDGTATYHPTDTLPAMDRGADVLVVKGGTSEVQRIGWPDASANRDAREYRIQLEPSGDATIELTLRPELNRAVWLRELLGNEPGKRKENLERLLGADFGDVQVEKFEVGDPLDIASRVSVEVRFRVRNFAPVQDGGLELAAEFDRNPLQRLTGLAARRLPLLLGLPSSESWTVRYRLPPGYAPLRLPDPVDLDAPFGRFRVSWRSDGEEVVVERERTLRTPRIQPAEYPEFREFAIRADQGDRHTVIIKARRP